MVHFQRDRPRVRGTLTMRIYKEQAREARFQERRLATLRDPRFRRWLAAAREKAAAWESAYGLDVGRHRNPRDG